MNDQLSMFPPETLPDTRNAISSPASADGLSPHDSPAGPMIANSGPARRRASRSASRARNVEPPMGGTCGPIFSGSSQQDGPPSCSESKSPTRREQNVKKDPCSNERSKAWREKNPERSRAIAKSSRTANRAGNMIADAKKRAKQKGLAFDLEDFREQLTARINSGLCELTGMQLRLSGGPRDWDTPSLDRIVPELGYTISNVRVIAFGLNVMMLTWGLDRAMSIMDALKAKEVERNESFQGRFAAALERRLRQIGSTECSLTYTHSVTPAGRRLFHVVPSMRPIDVTACGLWQTPVADDSVNRVRGKWNSRGEPKLSGQVMALWPTPTSLAPAKNGNNEAGNSAGLVAIRAHALAMWPTAQASDHRIGMPERYQGAQSLNGKRSNLNDAAARHGAELAGSSATTEKPGALNPAFVCWLMGFPAEWDACAPTVTRSSQRLRPK